jgi:hypothetical protein
MEVQGHIHDGMIIPHDPLLLPDGTKVTIIVPSSDAHASPQMSADERNRYLAAMARLDAMVNENPRDNFSGADHDRELYGSGSRFLLTAGLGLRDSFPTIRTIPRLPNGFWRMKSLL